MTQTIDMKLIRYLNLFEKVTKVRTNNCFFYNNFVFFAVPSALVSKAIGQEGRNVKKMAEILGRKIKIISQPRNVNEAGKFISDIVNPLTFKGLEISGREMIITATKQSKAALIGRNKVRLEEMNKIIEDYFEKGLRIV